MSRQKTVILLALAATCILLATGIGISTALRNPSSPYGVDTMKLKSKHTTCDSLCALIGRTTTQISAKSQAVCIEACSKKYGIPWKILYTLARTEVKSFDFSFHQVNDGYGNMQVLLSTGKMYDNINERTLTVPAVNYDIGAAHFASLLRYFDGDLRKAVLSYKRGILDENHQEEHWTIYRRLYRADFGKNPVRKLGF